MRLRSLLTMTALAAVALAGCADEGPNDEARETIYRLDEAGIPAAHPTYGFLTNAALPVAPEPGVIYADIDGVRTWFKPAYRGFPDAITGLDPIANVGSVAGGGHGIAVFGSLVFTGGTGGPLNIVDISVPDAPKVLGVYDDTPVRDADTILFPDGRLILITTAGGMDIFATDVTDPTNATLLTQFGTSNGNHNIAVVPGTPIVYNTGSGDRVDIVDFSDPVNPVELGQFVNGNRCHDIAFHINASLDRFWAICAGYGQTEIWDITDPTQPEMYVEIDYPSIDKGLPVVGGQMDDAGVPQDVASPAREACETTGQSQCSAVSAAHPSSFSHLAIINHDATVLIMGDETGGGSSNQCDFYYEGSDGQVHSGPIGNLWFYDITDPENPDLRGHVSPGYTDAEGSCTAHFGKTIGDTDYLVMAFYSAGVTLIDFQDLDNPRIVDRWDDGGNVWDVWFHQGYLVTGDMNRGLDVLSLS